MIQLVCPEGEEIGECDELLVCAEGEQMKECDGTASPNDV